MKTPTTTTAAASPTTLGFAAAGGGFLLPYHLGVMDALEEQAFLTPSTPLAGASAGAIAVAAAACGIPSAQILDDTMSIAQQVANNNNPSQPLPLLLPLIRQKLERRIDEQRFQALANRPGDTVVSYYELFPSWFTSRHESYFGNQEHLLDVLCHSCSFPFFSTTHAHWPLTGLDYSNYNYARFRFG